MVLSARYIDLQRILAGGVTLSVVQKELCVIRYGSSAEVLRRKYECWNMYTPMFGLATSFISSGHVPVILGTRTSSRSVIVT